MFLSCPCTEDLHDAGSILWLILPQSSGFRRGAEEHFHAASSAPRFLSGVCAQLFFGAAPPASEICSPGMQARDDVLGGREGTQKGIGASQPAPGSAKLARLAMAAMGTGRQQGHGGPATAFGSPPPWVRSDTPPTVGQGRAHTEGQGWNATGLVEAQIKGEETRLMPPSYKWATKLHLLDFGSHSAAP